MDTRIGRLEWILVIVVGAWILWKVLDVFEKPKAPHRSSRQLHLDFDGQYLVEVVGESRYQAALEEIAGGRSAHSANVRRRALLVREPHNPHDPNAVRVEIDGHLVGYLSRTDARAFCKQSSVAPDVVVTTDALIVGGWDNGGGDRGFFGVKLDLPVKEQST